MSREQDVTAEGASAVLAAERLGAGLGCVSEAYFDMEVNDEVTGLPKVCATREHWAVESIRVPATLVEYQILNCGFIVIFALLKINNFLPLLDLIGHLEKKAIFKAEQPRLAGSEKLRNRAALLQAIVMKP